MLTSVRPSFPRASHPPFIPHLRLFTSPKQRSREMQREGRDGEEKRKNWEKRLPFFVKDLQIEPPILYGTRNNTCALFASPPVPFPRRDMAHSSLSLSLPITGSNLSTILFYCTLSSRNAFRIRVRRMAIPVLDLGPEHTCSPLITSSPCLFLSPLSSSRIFLPHFRTHF